MTTPNDPARPCGTTSRSYLGLTKREHFALEILKGMLVSHPESDEELPAPGYADHAVMLADRLVERLGQ